MTHPTNTVHDDGHQPDDIEMLWLDEAPRYWFEGVEKACLTYAEFRALLEGFRDAVIEKLGASDAHAAAFYHPPSDEDPNEGLSFKWYGNAEPLYDATALAAARQQGRKEGLARAQSAIDQALNGTLIDPLNHDDDGLYDIPNAPRGVCSAIRHLAAARQPTQKEA